MHSKSFCLYAIIDVKMFHNQTTKWKVAIPESKESKRDKKAPKHRWVELKRLLQKNVHHTSYYKLFSLYLHFQSKNALGLFFYYLLTDAFCLEDVYGVKPLKSEMIKKKTETEKKINTEQKNLKQAKENLKKHDFQNLKDFEVKISSLEKMIQTKDKTIDTQQIEKNISELRNEKEKVKKLTDSIELYEKKIKTLSKLINKIFSYIKDPLCLIITIFPSLP